MTLHLLRRSSATVVLGGACLMAQLGAQALPSAGAPPQVSINTYIHNSWDILSRSMEECSSVRDVKVSTAPILYLPADVPEPPKVTALRSACGVEVLRLPRPIHHLGEVMPQELTRPGLLYLPNRYVVPGGRFNEMYGWDTYFILLGLVADHRVPLARGIVDNFFYEIEHYGALLNANRTYFLTRSQPPLLGEMIREVHQRDLAEHAPETNRPRIVPDRPGLPGTSTSAGDPCLRWQTTPATTPTLSGGCWRIRRMARAILFLPPPATPRAATRN